MKVNIVIGEKDLTWILGRLARELELHNGWTINLQNAHIPADIDYCIPYLMYDKATAPIKVGLYTHLEKDGPKRDVWYSSYTKFDYAIALSQATQIAYVKHAGTFKPSSIIHLGSDLHKEIVFGIVGSRQSWKRKNFDWVEPLQNEFNILFRPLSDSKEERQDFYSRIDYLIITSSVEGGPVPVLDAIATGVPVIAPNTGWAWDYPCIPYEKDNFEELKVILTKLNTKRTWADVAADHKKAFKSFM